MFGYRESTSDDHVNLEISYLILKNDLRNGYNINVSEKEIMELLDSYSAYRIFLFGLNNILRKDSKKGE